MATLLRLLHHTPTLKERFGSFAPERQHCQAKWFVHGEHYMAAVADAILKAKEDIFITDWMFSPQIFLKRSIKGVQSNEWRLDVMLKKKADEGVKIFILVWKAILSSLGSGFAQNCLSHPNITFLLSPNRWKNLTFLWSHHEKVVVIDQSLAFVGGIDLCYGRWDNCGHLLHDDYPKPEFLDYKEEDTSSSQHCQTWVGLDYMNDFKKAFTTDSFQKPFEDYLERTEIPRLPWHDIACCVYGEPAADVARHFKQRFHFTCDHEYSKTGHIPQEIKLKPYLKISDPLTTDCNCQVLRSVSSWSAGVNETEHSIQTGYIEAINNAEHFIYIENQFFISSLKSEGVMNKIAKAIRKRIARAYKEKKTFRVIIVMPLKPEFTGDFENPDDEVIHDVIHFKWQDVIPDMMHFVKNVGKVEIQSVLNLELLTISRGKESIFSLLTSDSGVPEAEIPNYISVYGLRTYSVQKAKPTTEIVYVHAKTMIVDDKVTIIGSANINDRSMKGDGDSEMVVFFEDKTMVDGMMNGEPYKAGEFSRSLRYNLFKEHLGVQDEALLVDPISEDFYNNVWKRTAERNSVIYEEVFGGQIVLSDQVKTYSQLDVYKLEKGLVETDFDKAKRQLKEVKGNLVTMPLHFLELEGEDMPDGDLGFGKNLIGNKIREVFD